MANMPMILLSPQVSTVTVKLEGDGVLENADALLDVLKDYLEDLGAQVSPHPSAPPLDIESGEVPTEALYFDVAFLPRQQGPLSLDAIMYKMVMILRDKTGAGVRHEPGSFIIC